MAAEVTVFPVPACCDFFLKLVKVRGQFVISEWVS